MNTVKKLYPKAMEFISILTKTRFMLFIQRLQTLLVFFTPRALRSERSEEISVILRTDLCSWKNLPGRTSNGHISITVLERRMVTMNHR